MIDAAILPFAEVLRPVEESRAEWTEIFGVSFSSKTKCMLKVSNQLHQKG